MSHQATNWAIMQRGLKPATKIVLWHLCDRHNPDQGCFPSQELLANDCEMSRASLNTHLKTLEDLGLIKRIQGHDPRSKKQLPTRYYFAFEEGENSPEPVSRIQTRENGKAESRKCEKPSPENDDSRVQNLDSNPVREPVREPLNAQARAREGSDLDEKKKAKAIEDAYWRLVKDWPDLRGMPKSRALNAWKRLSDEERAEAIAKFEPWLAMLRSQGKSHFPGPYTYFKDRLYSEIDQPKDAPELAVLKPFGKFWMALRLSLFRLPRRKWVPSSPFQQKQVEAGNGHLFEEARHRCEFPEVALMDEKASQGKSFTLPGGRQPPKIEGEYHAVKRGSALWEDWKEWHEAMDYPFIQPAEYTEYVWFPVEIPEVKAGGPIKEVVRHG